MQVARWEGASRAKVIELGDSKKGGPPNGRPFRRFLPAPGLEGKKDQPRFAFTNSQLTRFHHDSTNLARALR